MKAYLSKIDLETKFLGTRRRYYAVYTLLFCLMAAVVFSSYIFHGKSLVWYLDGWDQHYKALAYYGRFLRSILKNIVFEHRFVFPEWDFAIGEGSDIIQTLHYYVIGDPFSVLSVLCPYEDTYILYNVLIILRMYLSGIAFSSLCFYTKQKSSAGILAGSMVYVFCYWTLFNAARHPYFLNPMIYFPLIILGVEKLMNKERPYVLILSVMISAFSNFYFLYMLALLTVIYVAVRLIYSYRKDIGTGAVILLKITGASFLGVLMASVLLFPMAYAFLSSSRMSSGIPLYWIYPLSYYSQLPSLFLSEGENYWMCMGYAAPVLPAVFLLFRQKKEGGLLKSLFIICVIMTLVPAFGQILNEFSYRPNRWSWGFALVSAMILTVMFPHFMLITKKDLWTLAVFTVIYLIACALLEYSRTAVVFAQIGFVVLLLVVLFLLDTDTLYSRNLKQLFIVMVVAVSVFTNSFWKYSSGGENYVSEAMDIRAIQELQSVNNEATVVERIALAESDSFPYRYSGRSLSENVNIMSGLSSTQFYWTIGSSHVADYRDKLELLEYSLYNYQGYDDRTAPTALAGVKYYVVPAYDSQPAPYGFTYVTTIDISEPSNTISTEVEAGQEYNVYKNDHWLPLGYTYDSYISHETWNKLPAVEKQEAMLKSVVLEKSGSLVGESDLELTSQQHEYSLECGNGVTLLDNNTFVVTTAGATATLTFDGLPNSETYLAIKGLEFETAPDYDLYFGDESVDPLNLYNKTDWEQLSSEQQKLLKTEKAYWSHPGTAALTLSASNGISKVLKYRTEYYSYYADRHDFITNFIYGEGAVTSIAITFSSCGIYSFDSISVLSQPMDEYVANINKLKEESLENIKIWTDSVSGTISVSAPKVLCFSIPYSIGWKAYVDGAETPIYKANAAYMAIDLDAGEHTIQLSYHSPFVREGAFVSIAAIAIFIILVAHIERKNRKN